MNAITGYTRDTFPRAPEGRVMLAEYGECPEHLLGEWKIIAASPIKPWGYGAYVTALQLRHSTRGFVVAGSCLRWDEARWSVRFTDGRGCVQGRNWRDDAEGEAAARALFAKWAGEWKP
jgi:hypothetical protein